jgi:hypothetical protein
MARRPKSFGDRLQAAKDMAALYKYTQEVRGTLALLPDFAVDESGMRDSLHDAARLLFQEILLSSGPETGMDYGAIFDVTDVNLSERLKMLRSVEDPVATAHDWLLNLVAALQPETTAFGDEDLFFHLREEVVQFVNPDRVDQVRAFPEPLRGLGLVHLLDQHKARPRTSPVQIEEAESLINTFLDRDANEIGEVMADPNIHTARDVLGWERKQK